MKVPEGQNSHGSRQSIMLQMMDVLSNKLPTFVHEDFNQLEKIREHKRLAENELSEKEQSAIEASNRRIRKLAGVCTVACLVSFLLFFFLQFQRLISNETSISTKRFASSTPGTLPNIAFTLPGPSAFDYNAEILHCTIHDGKYWETTCEDHSANVSSCNVEDENFKHYEAQGAWCLPENLEVQGTFGHSTYQYVRVQFQPVNETKVGSVNIFMNDFRASILQKSWHSFWFNFGPFSQQHAEIYFKNVRTRFHGVDGQPSGSSIDSRARTMESLSYDSQYLRLECPGCDSGNGVSPFTFYLRSAFLVEENTVSPGVSIFEFLETAGGMWVMLTTFVFAPILLMLTMVIEKYKAGCWEICKWSFDE